jgi:uracil-DNA glycosylase family 4
LEKSINAIDEKVIACYRCPRLVSWREEVAQTKRKAYQTEEYWGKPVPGFGDIQGEVLVVGLAPGAHGSNRTGRMFTGDASGDFLFPALFRAGFANQPESFHRGDSLELHNLFITAICRCVPPLNKPTSQEIETCLPYLENEMALMENLKCIVALGGLAFQYLKKILVTQRHSVQHFKFAHNQRFWVGDGNPWLITSYHPSRQNTQTGKLTPAMFDAVWTNVNQVLQEE